MPTVGKFYLDKAGMGRYLRESRDLYRCIHLRARQGAAIARALAPQGKTGTYRDSIYVTAGRGFDGRVMALIVADAPYAVQVEHGRTRTNTYRGARVMSRMARILNTPRRRRA